MKRNGLEIPERNTNSVWNDLVMRPELFSDPKSKVIPTIIGPSDFGTRKQPRGTKLNNPAGEPTSLRAVCN